ncbi:hypothetical protein DFJ73DRAFT_263421 [Zopfochytrium polystomum]|nr:hypothetical protein DFJ73DRAFT_263421 [Zopfochytrium polystomum]
MPRPSMQMSFRAFGTNLTNALVDLFARPYNKPLTVPAFGVWAAFFAYILVTGIITLLVFMRFLTASPCIDQTMTLHELSKAYPNFDKCTFQYGTTNNPARSVIGMVEGAGFTITYTFVNPTEAANRNRPKVQPTLLPFYLNQTCSISHASSFSISQVIASVSPAGFDVVYPWARCGNADIYAQLTLRTNNYTQLCDLYILILFTMEALTDMPETHAGLSSQSSTPPSI